MSVNSRRHRSSTAASTAPEQTKATAVLAQLLDTLSATLRTRSGSLHPDITKVIGDVRPIRQCLIATAAPARPKDDFRHLNGFQILIDTLRAYSGFYHPTKRSQKEKEQLFELLEIILGVLAQTFRDHYGNRRYFKRRVEGGGWSALEQTIASIGVGGSESDIWSEAQLFGKLLAFALDDKRFEELCLHAGELHDLDSKKEEETPENDEDGEEPSKRQADAFFTTRSDEADSLKGDEKVILLVNDKLGDLLKESATLPNAEIVHIIIDFWKTIPRSDTAAVNPAALVVILTLSKVSSISKHNLLAVHSTGILSTLLPLAFDPDTILGDAERGCVEALCKSLVSLGVSGLEDAQFLITNDTPNTSEFLLEAMKASISPSCIQFDLSLNGYASIELPSLGRPFPPSSGGYTFQAWIYVDQFDPASHTTIFGAFDSTQTCFVLAYLERDTHNFILQTSVTSSRPSVRFKSVAFKERRWYHIVISHKRPKTLSASKAVLYVDGEFSEQVKCTYPANPPLSNASTESFASFASTTTKANPVQAFLGTPQDLSSRLGPGVIFSRWSLASAQLFEDIISDDLIAVYHRLGPRYNGNFQDCLGAFQTYTASAELGMRNDLMHPGKDETSDIMTAIRDKASTLVPENRILLSILPAAVMGDDDRYRRHESQLLRGLNRTSSSNLYQLTHNTGTSLAINAAIPSINEALTRMHGSTVLTGNPVVIVPQSMDNTMWRLGGFTGIALKLVENAKTKDGILRAVETLFTSINSSWRNSEAMERENGYAILGALLRGKIGAGTVVASRSSSNETSQLSVDDREKLGFQLLSLVLEFVGYNLEHPEESFIVNPLAYRILLVDYDMWRKTAPITQRLYYKQFITFGVQSKFHQFNSRRLFRMRRYSLKNSPLHTNIYARYC